MSHSLAHDPYSYDRHIMVLGRLAEVHQLFVTKWKTRDINPLKELIHRILHSLDRFQNSPDVPIDARDLTHLTRLAVKLGCEHHDEGHRTLNSNDRNLHALISTSLYSEVAKVHKMLVDEGNDINIDALTQLIKRVLRSLDCFRNSTSIWVDAQDLLHLVQLAEKLGCRHEDDGGQAERKFMTL
ncbi:MAG: hypothetical protein Q9181_002464 [Wetmoreana brouardii]